MSKKKLREFKLNTYLENLEARFTLLKELKLIQSEFHRIHADKQTVIDYDCCQDIKRLIGKRLIQYANKTGAANYQVSLIANGIFRVHIASDSFGSEPEWITINILSSTDN